MSEQWTAERIAQVRSDLPSAWHSPDVVLSLLDALESAREERWIAVTPETMPRVGEVVLAHYLNPQGKSRRVRAMLVGEETHPADDEYPDEWLPAGWYEHADNSELLWDIPTPTHWLPLPSPPVLP